MAKVTDVAAYILQKQGSMTAMKLQKLVYYSQAWSLVWDERALFEERIEAWANGPVCPDLYDAHRGRYTLSPGEIAGDVETLDGAARETIDAVLISYGTHSPQWLSDLTHLEKPWRDARRGFADGERCSVEITRGSLEEYYGSLPPSAPAV